MKTFTLTVVAMLVAFASPAQELRPAGLPPAGLPLASTPAAPAAVAKDPVNYLIHVEWTEPKGETKTLEVLTTEGNFDYEGIQKMSVKINGTDVPITLKLNGGISALSDERGRLQLFLGRTVPYVTGTSGSGPTSNSTYAQMNVGLQSTFIVRFGRPVVINTDENGKISVLVNRIAD